MTAPQFVRLKERGRRAIVFMLDGAPRQACVGDTILTALLTQGAIVRQGDFGGPSRAGFCLMGACQDCIVWLDGANRVRACTTIIEHGMRIATKWPPDPLAS
jgi:predicted molibdopterin-dependent oxidoreductase YjgC